MHVDLNRLKDLLLRGKRVLYHALSYVLYKATGDSQESPETGVVIVKQ